MPPDYRRVPHLPIAVHPLVLALDHGLDSRGTAAALEGGQNVLFLAGGASEPAINVVKAALAANRDRYVVAAAPSLGLFAGSYSRCVDHWCRTLGIESLDVLFALGIGRTASWSSGVTDRLAQLRSSGRVGRIGAGLRNRKHLAMLLDSPLVDFLVVPYSAAQRGAEREVFPFLEARRQANLRTPVVIASEATFSRALLRRPAKHEGRIPTAADCYRFCLSSPDVGLVFTGPRNLERARENLAAFREAGPLRPHEIEWISHFGDVVRQYEGADD